MLCRCFARCRFLGRITASVLGSVQLSAMVENGNTYHLLDMPENQVLCFIAVGKRL